LPVVGGTRPEHVSAFAITSLHLVACKRIEVAPSPQRRLRSSRPDEFAFSWSGAVAGLLARASFGVELVGAPLEPTFVRFRASMWSTLSRPQMLTPRVFRLEEPSPTIAQPLTFSVATWAPLARPQALTTGWHEPRVPITFATGRAQPGINPRGQDRAGAERIKNSTANDPERLTSYFREIVSVTLRSDATYPVVHSRSFAPRTRSLDLIRLSFVFYSATPRQGVPRLPSSYVPVCARAFRRQATKTKDTSGRRLQSYISKTSTRCFARLLSR
jgi:hypothetical protein